MSGVEGVGARSITDSSDTGGVAMPPPSARPAEHEHGVADLVEDVSTHLRSEAAAWVLEGAGMAGGGAVIVGIAWGRSMAVMAYATARSGVDGTREGLLHAAFGGDGTPTSRAYGAGIAACMLDASSARLAQIRDALPLSLHDDFAAGVEAAHRARGDEPVGWMEARAEYRQAFRDYTDGIAAALGGWNDTGRGEVFDAARERMNEALEADPARASELRASYHAGVREGFVAADGGAIDEGRMTMDAAYRAGVTHHRHEAASGQLDEARSRIVGFSAGSALLSAPIGA
jgi:hypothetical protein